eukprot:3934203-Rhodomonas_salina.1
MSPERCARLQAANAGFAHEFQMIDVEDLGGVGESEPTAHFFQARPAWLLAVGCWLLVVGCWLCGEIKHVQAKSMR